MTVSNTFTERMVRTFREEMTGHILIYNENDLYQVIKEYVEYYNEARTNSGLEFNDTKRKFSYSDELV